MKYINLFNPFLISQADRDNFSQKIVNASAPTIDFYFLVVLSTLIVSMGLVADNVVLLIGGMLVTPLLSPLLAFSLGMVIKNKKVILRSLKILFSSFVFVFVISFFVGFFSNAKVDNLEIISKMAPSLFLLLIAMIAGVAASYTWVKPELHENLAGIAVTVTLIPPLSAIGLAAASGSWIIFQDTLNLFILNVFGIIVSSLVIFSLMDLYKAKRSMVLEVEEEEIAIKNAKKEIFKNEEN